MAFLNKKLGKQMPETSKVVKVDSHPRLSGIMDSINASLAHGPATRLPSEFYEQEVRDTIDKICVEEWFGGYEEALEYRKLGIGGLVGDLTQKMVEHVTPIAGAKEGEEGGEKWKMSLSGCHDTTIAATLTALGGFRTKTDKWPNFTSSIAFELFSLREEEGAAAAEKKKGWFAKKGVNDPRAPLADMSKEQKERLQGKFVRIRYNDKVVSLPGCKAEGKHLEGDESFCTLEAFKAVADRFTPRDWRGECRMNLGTSAFPGSAEGVDGVD